MEKNFIPKLETEKYLIGSFDAYLDTTKQLIKNNQNLTDEEVDALLKGMPTNYRAAIVDRNGEYVGYIGLYAVDAKNDMASLRFETNKELHAHDREEILEEFYSYIVDSLNITDIPELVYVSNEGKKAEKSKIIPSSNVVMANDILVPGVSEEDLAKFKEQGYTIPTLQFPFTIKANDRTIGIIGLSSLIWSNKRANLNIFLDKELGDDVAKELSSMLIDDYINYVHASKVHNITLSVNASNKPMLDVLNGTKMSYYGTIPFGAINGDTVESNLMFQHIPNMKKENGIYVPDNKIAPVSLINTGKTEMSEKIELGNGFKMVRPSAFEKEGIDANHVIDGHVSAMQERNKFTIPLGEDKYFLQRGNGNYGLSKAVMNFSYVVLDENNNYAGYVNILRTNSDGKNVEIEIGIDPKAQRKGLGTMAISKFYDELFSMGAASVTSSVFEFNEPSIRLHEKVAELNGIRLESYYINGRQWDMNVYSQVNEKIKKL